MAASCFVGLINKCISSRSLGLPHILRLQKQELWMESFGRWKRRNWYDLHTESVSFVRNWSIELLICIMWKWIKEMPFKMELWSQLGKLSCLPGHNREKPTSLSRKKEELPLVQKQSQSKRKCHNSANEKPASPLNSCFPPIDFLSEQSLLTSFFSL